MGERRRRKKSENLEVRVEHELKAALMQRARAEGRSASDIVRDCIGAYLAGPQKEPRSMPFLWKSAAAAGAAAVVLWAGLASAPAGAAPDLRPAFKALDRNGDKSISFDEFVRPSGDQIFFVSKADATPPPAGVDRPFILPLRKAVPAPPPGSSAPPRDLLQRDFASQDRNRDGAVDFQEFSAYHRAVMQAGFAAIDRNGDGTLDRGEYDVEAKRAPGAASFGEIDANRDGRLSVDEFFG
jgi:hypothetical protein